MTSPSQDRLYGANSSLAIKAPCRVATTASITLSGLLTIDGVTLVAEDRVFVKNQATASENGIYIAGTSAWVRAPDFDGSRDVAEGTIILVNQGTANADTMWRVTNTGTIAIGTTGLTFEQAIASSSASLSFVQSGTGAVARTVQDKEREAVSALDFMTDAVKSAVIAGTNTTDVSTALQNAINTGRAVHCPYAGPYIVGTKLTYITTSANAYTQGLRIFGDGEEVTEFDNRVASDFMLQIDTNTTLKFQQGVKLEGFKIKSTTAPATSGGISIRRCAHIDIDHVKISGLTGDGVKIIVNEGDGDGSHYVCLRQSHITGCGGWGLNTEISAGLNELSFLVLDHTRVESCGAASGATPPPSGGIKWRGQIMHLHDGACVTNENIGLYVVGGAGLGSNLNIKEWTFENNKGKHVLIEGIQNVQMHDIQLYSNDSFVATNGIEIDGSASGCRNITIDGVKVRATSGNNPYTAFKASGANAEKDTIRVRNVSWDNFDFTGQTRYDGIQFDAMFGQCEFIAGDATFGRLRPKGFGTKVPIKLKATGEWMMSEVASGGVSKDNTGLVANTTYFVYVFNNGGTSAPVMALEYSTTAPVIDTTVGVMVKTGDTTRTLVGMFRTEGSTPGQFQTTRPMLTRSWFVRNPQTDRKVMPATVNTTSATYVEIDSTNMRLEACLWDDEVFDVEVSGACSNDVNAGGVYTSIGFDGTTAETMTEGITATGTTSGLVVPVSPRAIKSGLAVGYHYATVLGRINGGTTAYWAGTGAASTGLTISGAIHRRG